MWYASKVRNVTFVDGQISINQTDGTSKRFDISSVGKLTFGEGEGAVGNLIGNNALRVYPNPVSEWLTVENADDGAEVSVYGLDGRRWLTGSSDARLYVGSLPAGFYVVKIGTQSFKISKK